MSDFEFVDPSTGAALGAHAFGTVAAGTVSTPKAIRLRYKHGQTGSGAPANALVMRVSENGGSTWRDAVTEFTLAITAVSAPDVLYTERVRSLGRGTRWPLAPFRAGCYADLTLTFTPDKRTGAASTPLSWELGIDESQAIPVAYNPAAPIGVLSGIGRADVNEWITAPTLANGTDKTTMGAADWVHAGIRYTLVGGDVALSQSDVNAAALGSGEEYVAVLSVGAGVRTVTKGAKATAGTALTPAIPAGDLPEATVRVPYGGVIATSTLHAVSGRCAVSDGGGLVVNVQPGRVVVPGWYAAPSAVQQITVTDGAIAATGEITCVAVASLIDGETVTINGTVYEFDVAGNGVAGANEVVDVSTLTTDLEVADALTTAINGVGAVDAVDNLDGTISLTHLTTGAAGNVTITETVADAGFLVSGFTGGADGSVTVYLGATGAPSLVDGAPLATVTTADGDIVSITDARVFVDGWGEVPFTSSLLPTTDDAISLGSAAKQYQYAHVARGILGGRTKTLTDGSATNFATIALADGAATGGEIIYRVTASSGADRQCVSGRVRYSGVRNGATYDGEIVESGLPATTVTTGTLAGAISIAAAGGALTFSANYNSSLSSPTVTLYWRADSTDVIEPAGV